jgi:plastocyanin domain-containing protein
MEKKKNKKGNSKLWMIATVVLVVTLFGLVSAKNISTVDSTGNIVDADYAREVQKATLKFENFEYVLEPSTLKAGIPVEIEVDMSTVQGCMQAINIPSLNVEKYVTVGDNIITFIPDEKGTVGITCSMGMGTGEFTVVE